MGEATTEPAGDLAHTGVIIVDHGSRRDESNHMLEAFVESFRGHSPYAIIEPAHMEMAEPGIAAAFARCVAQGATTVVVCPYFLLPGKHWDEDIPRLTAAAAAQHPGVHYMVTAPIGLHPMMKDVIEHRIDYCLQHAGGSAPECESCRGRDKCVLKEAK